MAAAPTTVGTPIARTGIPNVSFVRPGMNSCIRQLDGGSKAPDAAGCQSVNGDHQIRLYLLNNAQQDPGSFHSRLGHNTGSYGF